MQQLFHKTMRGSIWEGLASFFVEEIDTHAVTSLAKKTCFSLPLLGCIGTILDRGTNKQLSWSLCFLPFSVLPKNVCTLKNLLEKDERNCHCHFVSYKTPARRQDFWWIFPSRVDWTSKVFEQSFFKKKYPCSIISYTFLLPLPVFCRHNLTQIYLPRSLFYRSFPKMGKCASTIIIGGGGLHRGRREFEVTGWIMHGELPMGVLGTYLHMHAHTYISQKGTYHDNSYCAIGK